MNKIDNPAKGIVGTRVGGDPKDEREHYFTCDTCGQAVDMRDLGQLLHHQTPGHKPITPDA